MLGLLGPGLASTIWLVYGYSENFVVNEHRNEHRVAADTSPYRDHISRP
jgi:hypothetical protein